jgi:nicotinamidase-related amidase
MLELDAKTTALILIDLQKGIVALPLAPHSGADVFARGIQLSERFRAAGSPVARVRVDFGPGGAYGPSGKVDAVHTRGPLPSDFADFPDDPAAQGDFVVTKRHWGAFHGTDLDLLLRRRGVRTVVIGGIATNIGVESTARSAHEHSYDVVLVEDVTTGQSAEMHEFAFRNIFPRLSRVVKTADLRLI